MRWINIARFTGLELWQSHAYKMLLLFALLIPLVAMLFSSLFMVDIGKVYMDVIAGAAQLLAMLFLLFLAVTLLNRDMHEHVCYTLLAPPVTRTDYFVGRFMGISLAFMVLLCCLLVSSSLGGLVYLEQKAEFYQSAYIWLHIAAMVFFCFFQYIAILGVIFFMVSWSSGSAETWLFTVAVLLFSWLFPPVLSAMQNPDVAADTPVAVMHILQWLYEVLPHLQGADISLQLAHGIAIVWHDALLYVAEHLLYALVFFMLGLYIFKRRDL